MSQDRVTTHATAARQAASKSNAIQSPAQKAGNYLPEVSIELDTLPSRSIPYPENSKVKYRPFAFGEVKKLSESKNLSIRDRFKEVLNGIETVGFNKGDLTLFDFLYIGLLRKISTLGSRELTAQFQCGKCHQKGSHKFTLDQIEFNDMKAPALPISVDMWGRQGVEFSPPTVRDFVELAESGKHRDDVAMIASAVKNIPFEEAYALVYNSTADDVEALREIDEYLEHDVKPMEFVCGQVTDKELGTRCDNKIKIEVSEEDTLIMPFRRDKQPTSSRLRFGSQVEHQSN